MSEKSILTKLFLGEIHPCERWISQAAHIRKEINKLNHLEEEFFQTLTPNQIKDYDRCKSLIYAMNSMESADIFCYGFRLGMLITQEVNQISDRYMGDVVL